MASVYWYSNAKTSIVIELQRNGQWKTFHEVIKRAHVLSNEVTHEVDLIVLVPEQLPAGNPIAQFSRAFNDQPDHIRSIIIVPPVMGASQTLQLVIRLSLITNLLFPRKSRVVFVKSLEAALSYTTVSS